MWVLQAQKDLLDLSKHYIDEIDELVSLDRAEYVLHLKKKNKKRENSYIVVRKSLVDNASVSVGFKYTK